MNNISVSQIILAIEKDCFIFVKKLRVMKRQSLSKILRGAFKYLIPLFISVGLCYLLFTGVDFGEMMDKIKDEGNNLW